MRKLICSLIGCFSFAVAPVSAQVVTNFTDWDLVCPTVSEELETEPACHLSQTVQSSDSQFNLMLATVVQRDELPVLILTTPLGIDLGAGLAWRVDARQKRRFIFNTCTLEGCFAAIKLDKTLTNELRRGNVLSATYRDGAGNPIEAVVSLSGFITATKALKEK